MRKITIITPSRLHFALVDLNGSLGRVDGSIGLSLAYPGFKIVAQYSDETNIIASPEISYRANRILSLLKNRCDIGGVAIEIKENIPSHVGLGSGTQLSLGIAKAVCTLYDLDTSYQEMAFIVERGGTSGIGVAAFSQGGFIVDGGHEFSKDKLCEGIKNSFLPSSASKGINPPPIIARYDFPDWDILVTIPNCKHISGDDEVRLFQTLCPMPLEDVQAISHIILLKLLPAVVQKDIVSFGEAIDLIQNIGWKKVEIEKQDEIVRQMMAFLRENGGYGVGLSSWGPAIFCFGKDLIKLMKKTNNYLIENHIGGYCFITHANNSGATVIDENGIYRSGLETANQQRSFH
ncbi:MAG: beta-ribofuranosylaminobenzene 5'-phosphate synthase [Candidatus Poribacteria bacterium]